MKKIQLENRPFIENGSISGPLDNQLNLDESGLLNESGLLDNSGALDPDYEGEGVIAGSGSLRIEAPGISFLINLSWTNGGVTRPVFSQISIDECELSSLEYEVTGFYTTWYASYSINIIIYYYKKDPDGNHPSPSQVLGNYSIPTLYRTTK